MSKNLYGTARWKKRRRQVLERDGYRCQDCGCEVVRCSNSEPLPEGKRRATVDHVVPVVQGGDRWDPDNLQTLCEKCHTRKDSELGNGTGVKNVSCTICRQSMSIIKFKAHLHRKHGGDRFRQPLTREELGFTMDTMISRNDWSIFKTRMPEEP